MERDVKLSETSEKICPSCGQWTTWSKQPHDRCIHCGFELMAETIRKEEIRKERFYEKPAGLITIKGTEPAWLQGVYRGINYVYFIFVGIMAAIVWFITTVAG